MDVAVAWFLRQLTMQFFRPTENLGTMADEELTKLFASDFNEDPVIDIASSLCPTEEGGFQLQLRDVLIGPIREDTSPLNYRAEAPALFQAVRCEVKTKDTSLPEAVLCAD